MTRLFRYSLFMLLLIGQNCFCQDNLSSIYSNWNNLKTQLQSRTTISNNLANVLEKSNVDKKQLKSVKFFSLELSNLLEKLNSIDSSSVLLVFNMNKKLTEALTRTLVILETHPESKGEKIVIKLIARLEECENDIAFAKRKYNISCNESGKFNLVFGIDQSDNSIEIKF